MMIASSRKSALLRFSFILLTLIFTWPLSDAQARTTKKQNKTAIKALQPALPEASLAHWHEAEKRLENAIASGGWPKVPEKAKLKLEPGADDPIITAIRTYLQSVGDLPAPKKSRKKLKTAPLNSVYDEALAAAVIRFQTRHGLEPDGIIGNGTVKAMNVSPQVRLNQLRINQERIENLPNDSGKSLLVNIPQFTLYGLSGSHHPDFTMRVIVGERRADHRTPLLDAEISYVVINPQWHVPQSIMTKEMLPKLKNDATYLSRQNMKVMQTVDGQTISVDPTTVDWSKVDSTTFNYRFAQDSGAGNALGRIKFIFPNRHNVYLHDTTTKSLFARGVRDFSHGCVRVHKPLDLAEYVLADNAGWSKEAVETAIKRGAQKVVFLKEKLPVHLTYVTAWVDANGNGYFLDDIYGYDRRARKK
jgi:murein L,D-transpeptidase YcbB/YkuD